MPYTPHFDTSDAGLNSVHTSIMDWTPGKLYRVGELAIYLNKIYRCTLNHSSYSFNNAKWSCIAGSAFYDEVGDLPSVGSNEVIYIIGSDYTNDNRMNLYIWNGTIYSALNQSANEGVGLNYVILATTTSSTPLEIFLEETTQLVMSEGDILFLEMKIFISNPLTLESNIVTYSRGIKRDALTTTMTEPQIYVMYHNFDNAALTMTQDGTFLENVNFIITGEADTVLNWKIYVNLKDFNVDGLPGMSS